MSAATGWGSWVALIVTVLAATPAHAGPALRLAPSPEAKAPAPRAHIAIIIDDLGEQHLAGVHALRLPGPVALAFLPGAHFTRAQAMAAHARGKEVLLHLPLQPAGPARAHPATLTVDTGYEQLRASFAAALASVPYASGVNNHQGSLLTTHPAPMDWLMREIALRPALYFVDSRTSSLSVAYRAARMRGIPSTERNVFLDTDRGETAVRAAFHELIDKARRNDRAVAIGHPYPETFKVLEEELPQLATRYGVRLVAPSELIARQSGWRGPYRPLKLNPAVTLATGSPGAAGTH